MQRAKGVKKTKQNIHELGDNYKRCNIHVLEIPEQEKREKGTEEL